ncbi:LOW QUALITY PROTEIN: 5'-nucleotidase [Boleophthalmus pectinirostris]|uniref:LOW QUALITY PROTEIN: 5'-nucleotidase n=1 Tax=Boleophthalmus pectinirostris TaxID=150288 RepID=UPI00242D15D4|nr:LOW QUALITY PROTEIN: 5'-nucleotidase [Boleophthalmus pectinirostris]
MVEVGVVPRSSRAALRGPRLLFLGVRLFFLSLLCSGAAGFELVLLHTNDVHARVEETSAFSGKCSRSRGAPCFGGVARRATLVRRLREAGAPVLLLDAGDQFQGSVWFSFYKGAEAAHFMNALRYDAMALGNHEFDNGVPGLMDPFLREIQCPVLSANLRTDAPLAATFGTAFSPYKVLSVGGEQVGVVGYTSRETPALSDPGPHVHFEDELSALQRQVDKLQTLGVNKIIALGHSGFTVDQEIARTVRGVDVVIGGHSNTFLYTGSPPSVEVPVGPYPFLVRSVDGRQVPVVQAYAFGKYLGHLHIRFDDEGNVLEAHGNPILLDESIPEDPDVLNQVEEWKENLKSFSSQVVGRTLVFLNGSNEECRFRECNLGNLICDAMVDSALGFSEDLQWNHVSAALMNGGGVRNSIDEETRNGSITMEDLLSVLPFGGTIDLVSLKGSTLKKAFEHSVHRYGQSTGEFLQVSGFQVEVDLTMPPYSRVRALRILCTRCRVPTFDPVQDDSVYRVLMPSYMVTGGDGFSMIPDEMVKHNSGDLDISVVSAFLSKRGVVHPAVEGRIRIVSSASVSVTSVCALLPLLLWGAL